MEFTQENIQNKEEKELINYQLDLNELKDE